MFKTQYQRALKINFFSFLFIALSMLILLAFFLNSKGSEFYKHINAQDVSQSIKDTIQKVKKQQSVSTNDENFSKSSANLISLAEDVSRYEDFLNLDDLEPKIASSSLALGKQIKNFSVPEARIWKTYRNSVLTLFKFFESNKWKSLTTISKRVHYRTFTKHNLKENFMEILSANLKDFNSMLGVSERSGLSAGKKKIISERINAMIYDTNKRLEIENKFASFKGEFTTLQNLMSTWATKSSDKSIETSDLKDFKFLGFSDIIYLTFLTGIAIFAFFFISKKTSEFLRTSFEKDTLQLIDKVMIKGDNQFLKGHNPQFQTAVTTLQNYVSKRMSFGHIFQNTLPFPCILLDQSLMVKWVNDSLTQSLKLSKEEIKSKYKSWDQLNKFFEFNGNDPVVESLNLNQSGIYKFKLAQDGEEKLYEIYVNPLKHEDDEYIMLYFNTLTPIQDAINLQVDHVLESMTAIIEDLEQGNLKITHLSNEFDIPGISKVYEKLLDFVDYSSKKSNKLEKELEEVHDTLSQKYETLESIKEINNEVVSVYEQIPSKFISLREDFIKLLENQNIYSELNEELVGNCRKSSELLTEKFESYEKVKYVAERCESWLIPELTEVRSMMSSLKVDSKNIDTKKFEIFFSKLELILNDFKNLNVSFNKMNEGGLHKFNSIDFQQSLALLEKSKMISEENIVNALKELVSMTKKFGKEIGRIDEKVQFISSNTESKNELQVNSEALVASQVLNTSASQASLS